MPKTTNVVHAEAQLVEAINAEENRAKMWEQTHGAALGTPAAFATKSVWDPNALSKERKLFETRARGEFSRRTPTTIVPGEQYEWARPKGQNTTLCRSELLASRRREFADAADAERTGGLPIKLDRPTFGSNETFTTFNSSGLIGQASAYTRPERPTFARLSWRTDGYTASRNDATQLMFPQRTTGGMQRATASVLSTHARLFG